MNREKQIEKFIKKNKINVYTVERIARGHYKIFYNVNEYTSFKINAYHYTDTKTYSYNEIFEELGMIKEEQKINS